MVGATFHTASETGVSSTMNLVHECRDFIFHMNPCSVYSIKMVTSVFGGIVVNARWQRHSSSSYWTITWRGGMGCYSIHISVISCSHRRHFEQCVTFLVVLRPVVLSFIRVLRNPTFKQDNTRSRCRYCTDLP
ncbi:hypothetical protein TNCV_3562341 [Trichonephila clavipes]|nr:hypothetical protein TNCV_3562341 [Trichonephila clavipes]